MAERPQGQHDASPSGAPLGESPVRQPWRWKPVGDGVFEMQEHFRPGWRMYYVQRGTVLIVMLGGGDKATQTADIARAVKLAAMLED